MVQFEVECHKHIINIETKKIETHRHFVIEQSKDC